LDAEAGDCASCHRDVDLDHRAADPADPPRRRIRLRQPPRNWLIAGDFEDAFGIEIAQVHDWHKSVSCERFARHYIVTNGRPVRAAAAPANALPGTLAPPGHRMAV